MVDLGCLWSVHARVENYSKAFVIKQFDDVHTCGSSFRTVKHARMTSSMIGGLISSDIRNKALTSVSEVVCDFKDYYGTEVSYRRSWMGVEKARGIVFGDYSSSFDNLRWYVDAANDCNPESVFDMEFDVDSKGRHFKCLFFAFETCIHVFKYCRPVLMLGGTFLKGRHKGCLLAATTKDVTKTNLKTYLSVKSRKSEEYLLTLFSRCAYAPTIELFNKLFEEFKGHCGRSVEKFLEDLPNECWCNAYFQGKRYGEICTNAAESFNSWIRDERHLFSTSLVDAIQRSVNDLNCFLDDYDRISSYCDSYSHSIYLIPSMWKPNIVVDDDVVLPPLCKRPTGRPRTERIPSKDEIKRIRCSRCGKMGTHNRKTCKEALL
ncbi:hypothetical protein ACSBR1_031586 [Camellia fascicularis]